MNPTPRSLLNDPGHFREVSAVLVDPEDYLENVHLTIRFLTVCLVPLGDV